MFKYCSVSDILISPYTALMCLWNGLCNFHFTSIYNAESFICPYCTARGSVGIPSNGSGRRVRYTKYFVARGYVQTMQQLPSKYKIDN